MASRAKFPVYRGEQPYIFISYAHADSDKVLPIAEELHNQRYRVWYDEGIEAGVKWPEYIATHLLKTTAVLFFTSERFHASHNCEREVNFTVDAKKPMVIVSLDASAPPPGMKMQLSSAPVVPAVESAADTAARIIASGALGDELIGDGVEGYAVETGRVKRRFNAALFFGIVGVTLALGFGLALLGYMQGWFGEDSGVQKETVTISEDGTDGTALDVEVLTWTSAPARNVLLSQVYDDVLYCCGNTLVASRIAIDYQGGAYLVTGKPVVRGDISDLGIIVSHENLVELSLCYQTITDISALSALTGLTYLDLSDNPFSDLSPLTNLTQLTTLKLSRTDVTDLTPLLELSALKKLYVSYDMIDSIEAVLSGGFDIIVTE